MYTHICVYIYIYIRTHMYMYITHLYNVFMHACACTYARTFFAHMLGNTRHESGTTDTHTLRLYHPVRAMLCLPLCALYLPCHVPTSLQRVPNSIHHLHTNGM